MYTMYAIISCYMIFIYLHTIYICTSPLGTANARCGMGMAEAEFFPPRGIQSRDSDPEAGIVTPFGSWGDQISVMRLLVPGLTGREEIQEYFF